MGKGMKAGKKPSQKQPKMNQMAQLLAMQAKMAEAQGQIEEMETEASAGGGAVTVKVNGKHEMVALAIKPEVCDPDDVEMLQDLIIAATNEAMRQMGEVSQSEQGKLTPGLGLPAGLV